MLLAPFRRAKTRKPQPAPTPAPKRLSLSVENLETRLSMHSNPVMDAEHAQVMALVSDSALTYRSVNSGSWSNSATWEHLTAAGWAADGTTPNANANVLISANTSVVIDKKLSTDSSGNRLAFRTIRDDGILSFDTSANTDILVDTIVVAPKARFEMGTESNRINATVSAKVIFADNGDIDKTWDPLQFSRGLISHGSVSLFGTEKTSFVKLGSGLVAGSSTIDLGSTLPADWKIGDRLTISGNTAANSNGDNQDEEVAIAAINGTTITLGTIVDSSGTLALTPLKFNHNPGSVYIANVSRNAVFQSESVAIGNNTVAHRGHIMFMHNDDVHVDSVGFYALGRTDKRTLIDDPILVDDPDHPGQKTTDVIGLDINTIDGTHRVYVPVVDAAGNKVKNPDGTQKLEIAKTGLNPRGRYAVHFHRTGNSGHHVVEPVTIARSAVVDSPGWGIVNHSSNVDVTDNIVFNATGAAFVTEAGDEIGSFQRNLAMHSMGSGDGVESRKHVQDFGHQGDGFWLQGGNVSLVDNVATGMRHSGFVFFPVGLDQKGLGITRISSSTLANPAWANGAETIAVGDVPLREFKGNSAFASGNGFESWFSMLNVRDDRRTVIEDFKAWNTRNAPIFTPYTNQITFKNVTLTGNLENPRGKAFDRNNVTRSVEYDHVNIQGFDVGIDVAVNGKNIIRGGTFNNLRSVVVSTANDPGRTVDFVDAADQLMTFLDLSATALNGRVQQDIVLNSNFNPHMQDITTVFNPDVIKMGTVRLNGKQLYYKEQAPDFVPFPAATAEKYVPSELLNKTNAQLYAQYGLAIGGIVAPPDAAASDPRIYALVGSASTYPPEVRLNSDKYINPAVKPFKLSYRYQDPTNLKANKQGWVSVTETTVSSLKAGWNVVTRNILGQVRSFLVYSDKIPPTFEFNKGTPTGINKADIDNGGKFVVSGSILDDSFGRRSFYQEIKLNDPKHVSPIKTRSDGTRFVTISFTIKDLAGNSAVITRDLTVTFTETLQKDVGRKKLPTIKPSKTILALLNPPTLLPKVGIKF